MTPPYKTRTQMVMENLAAGYCVGEFAAGAPAPGRHRQGAGGEPHPGAGSPDATGAQGLVKFEAHRGAVVTMLDASAIEELFYLRALLEADTLFHAVDLMTEETFARRKPSSPSLIWRWSLAPRSNTGPS